MCSIGIGTLCSIPFGLLRIITSNMRALTQMHTSQIRTDICTRTVFIPIYSILHA